MSPNRSRFVTACQQLLALGVVLAALTPAASVVTLDVVGTGPTGTGGTVVGPGTAALAAYTAEAVKESKVPTVPVKSQVREVQLTSPTITAGRAIPHPLRPGRAGARSEHADHHAPEGDRLRRGGRDLGARRRDPRGRPARQGAHPYRRRLVAVERVPYDPDHGPDPGSAEARHARPGTDAVLVGRVDDVQVRIVRSGRCRRT